MPGVMGFGTPAPAGLQQAPEEGSYLEKLQRILMGGGGNAGGMLDEGAQKAARNQAMLAMAAQLMQAGGQSDRRVGFGEAMGSGLQAGMQAGQQAEQQALQSMLLQSQIQKSKQKDRGKLVTVMDPATGKPVLRYEGDAEGQHPYTKPGSEYGAYQPGDYTPVSWAKFLQSKDPAVLERYATPRQEYSPSFQNVTKTLPDGSTQQGTFDTRTGAYNWAGEIVSPGKKQEVESAGKVRGENLATAQSDLPRVEDNASQALKTIEDFEKHPGFKYVFGWDSVAPTIPGSTQAGALAYYDQIKGKTFLEAFNSLKGAGQITEIEGQKATDAIARLNRAQSEKDAKVALADLREVVEAGRTRAQKKAGVTPSTPPRRIRVDAQGNVVQ